MRKFMQPHESDLQFAYCNVNHENKFYTDCFVSVLEYTHRYSAVPRARVVYHCPEFSKEFFIPREKLIRPIQLQSDMQVWWDGFNISILAYFYKHPEQEFCDESTPYKIERINANGFSLDTLAELAEFIVKPLDLVEAEMRKELLCYVDELPF